MPRSSFYEFSPVYVKFTVILINNDKRLLKSCQGMRQTRFCQPSGAGHCPRCTQRRGRPSPCEHSQQAGPARQARAAAYNGGIKRAVWHLKGGGTAILHSEVISSLRLAQPQTAIPTIGQRGEQEATSLPWSS